MRRTGKADRIADRGWSTAVYLGVAVLLTVVVWQSSVHLRPEQPGLAPRVTLAHGDRVLGPWLFWDAAAYDEIATHGYTDRDVVTFHDGGEARVAFFPAYPLVVRGVASLVGDTGTALMVVTFAAGLGVSILLYKWFRRHTEGRSSARMAFLAVVLFPWAYFLVATGYGDALFLLCAVSSFLLVEDDRPIAAGIVGAVAASTRIVGIAVVIGLVIRAAERRGALELDGWRPRLTIRRLRRADVGVVLSAAGLMSYMAFCWTRYGDPVAFSTAQRGWGSARGLRTWIKQPLLDLILHSPDHWFVLRLVLHGLVGLCFLAALPAVWRRFGPAYGTYTLITVGLPMLGASAFQSMGRHVLAAFPVFALLGERLDSSDHPRRARAYLISSGIILVVWTSQWGRGYWMG